MPTQIDERRLIQKLWDNGGFWDPTKLEALNVKQSDLASLTLQDREVKEAVASWQSKDANFDVLSLILHLRGIVADGEAGPVTASMLEVPCCPIPNAAPPPHASFHYSDPELQAAVESYQRFSEASGSGSWPVPGCDPTRKNAAAEHSLRVGMNTSRCPASIKAYLNEAILLTRKCSAESGCAVRYVFDGSDAEFDVQWEAIPGNIIGYCYFPTPGTCSQVVKSRLDTGYDAGAILLANLMQHEFLGHGIGLEHTRGGVMNPSILKVDPLSWRGDPSESIVKRYFGGQPVPLDDTNPTPTPVEPYNGIFVWDGKVIKIRVF